MSEILTKEFLSKYKNKQPNWGFNGLGYIVYKRTYSRLKDDGSLEEWPDTIERCIRGAQKIGAKYTQKEAERLFDLIFNLKCNFAGRMLWQLGTTTVDRFGANSLLNCWVTSIAKPEDFCFLFENLMLGGGVGFSIRKEDVHELPRIKKNVLIINKNTKDADFIVPDSREGWVELLRKTLDSLFITGKGFSFSTILVRGYGEKIKGFGGTASGPQILIEGIKKICHIANEREGKKLRSIDALDICNVIGSIVVAGNVRRTAQIALGDADDILFLRAKRWDLGSIPNYRAMSNNTIIADSFDYTTDEFWKGYNGNGEPYGLFNLDLCQNYGRLKEKINDKGIVGVNPCGEIPLADKECCNLSELYLNNITSKEELFECAKLLYKTQKAISAMPFIHEETNKIVHKNMRLGLGVTGICQSLNKLEWLNDCYEKLREFDKYWSKENGWPESIKLTTCKPSGTLSLLSGSTPGVHPGYSEYYIRRVRISSEDPLVEICKSLEFKTEFVVNFDGTQDHKTTIIEFPCNLLDGIVAEKMSAIEQLELVRTIQTNWADNAVSVTVYYKPEELEDIKAWLEKNYKNSIKSVSFLRHEEHGFKQAPYEKISKEEYEKLIKEVKKIDSIMIQDSKQYEIENLECAGGICPIK